MLIEFAGTPCAGKDSVINAVVSDGQIKKRFSTIQVLEETIWRVDKAKSRRQRNIQSLQHIQNDIRAQREKIGERSSLFIANRGLFDRLAFLRLSRRTTNLEVSALNSIELTQVSCIFLFVTSFEKAYYRKISHKGDTSKRFRIVNKETITALNNNYRELYSHFCEDLPIVLIDDDTQDLSLAEKISCVKKHIRRLYFV